MTDDRKDELLMSAMQFIGSIHAVKDFQEYLDDFEISRLTEKEKNLWDLQAFEDPDMWDE